MNNDLYLVIDIGTSSMKAAVCTDAGEMLSSIHRSVMGPSESPRSFTSDRWITAIEESLPQLVGAFTIRAVVISGNGPTVVAVDREGSAIGPPLLWLDDRTDPYPGGVSFYLPKIRWFQRNMAEADRVRWYLPFPEYLVFALTGEAVAITPGSEFNRFIWDEQEVRDSSVDPACLPPFVTIGSVAGRVTSAAQELTGIPAGTPVVAAGSDFLMSLIGTNTLRPGQTCDRAGTSEGINYCSDRAVRSEQLRTLPHVVEGCYNVAGILSSTGLLFEWFREISGQRSHDYGDMMLDIIRVPDGADTPWFFPSLQRRGSWEFQRGMFIGLGAHHSRAEMGRAVVLSIGFAVREALGILAEAGCPVRELNACGGQARNGLWTQMKADIADVPIHVPAIPDAELIGNLCCGLLAMKEAASLQEAADRVVHMVHTYQPEPARSALYREQYEQYQARFQRFQAALDACC